MAIVNLGILAHVDAGKTSLAERILFETGVIGTVGRVDTGITQTDTLELERARGITIKSAVMSFQLHGFQVNLIDTPGHADFIAEVERSLRVLDAVVLLVSAVEGVQPQTRRLVWAIRAAGLPLLIFVNKIDHLGARGDALPGRSAPQTQTSRPGDEWRVRPRRPGGAAVVTPPRDDPSWHASAVDLLLELPEDTFGATSGALLHARATMHNAFLDGASYHVVDEIPSVEVRAFEQQLPALTRGEGVWVSAFGGYTPVRGPIPTRERSEASPLNRAHYLAEVARGRITGSGYHLGG